MLDSYVEYIQHNVRIYGEYAVMCCIFWYNKNTKLKGRVFMFELNSFISKYDNYML